MSLSEEQRNPWRAIVAGSDYNLSSQDWEDLLTELDSLYTEATIAPPEQGNYKAQRDINIEAIDDAIAESLGEAYDCTRVWSAWSYGTMGPDDFQLVSEDSNRIAEIRDAVIAAIASVKGGE